MHRLVLAMCLLALAACSPGAASSTAQLRATAAVTPTQAPQPTFTTVPQSTSTPTPASTPPPTSFDKPGKVGQPVENGGVALTVISTTLTSQIDQATPAGAGEAYLVADVLFENVSSDKVSYDVIFFSVLDANGVEYISSRVAPAPALKSGDLMPGDKVRGNVAFKMTAAATGLAIKYQPVVMGPSPRIYIAVP